MTFWSEQWHRRFMRAHTSFSNICIDLSCGTVNFPVALLTARTAYFALESNANLSNLDHGMSGNTPFTFVLTSELRTRDAALSRGPCRSGAMRRRRSPRRNTLVPNLCLIRAGPHLRPALILAAVESSAWNP